MKIRQTIVMGILLGSTGWAINSHAQTWYEDWEAYANGQLTTVTGGNWFSGTVPTTANQVRLQIEDYSIRPAGMGSIPENRVAAGPTSGNFTGSRSLGGFYTSGILSLDGWLDSRSHDPNTGNFAGFGFDSSPTPVGGITVPNVWVRYLWSLDTIALFTNAVGVTSGDAFGTSSVATAHTNPSLTLGNQWNHVKLEVNLDTDIARMYIDTDRTTADGPWSQLGVDVPISSSLGLGYAMTLNSRDGNTDNLLFIPEPASLGLLGLGMLMAFHRRWRS